MSPLVSAVSGNSFTIKGANLARRSSASAISSSETYFCQKRIKYGSFFVQFYVLDKNEKMLVIACLIWYNINP